MPSRVSSFVLRSIDLTSPSSRSRPMKDVGWCGRLFGISRTGNHQSPARTTRYTFSPSAGATKRASGCPASNSSSGSEMPLSIQCPCDTTFRLVLPSWSRASLVSSVCPGSARDMTRAAVGLARPSTSSGLAPRATSAAAFSRRMTGPTCRPARAVSGTAICASAECNARAYATASVAASNSSSMPSVLSISRPRQVASSTRAMRS